MANKLRVTGFTRFLLFLLFVVPLAYFGASYYNGENGVDNIKELIGSKEKTKTVSSKTPDNQITTNTAEFTECMKALERIQRTLERKDREIEDLEAKIKELRNRN